MTAKKFPPAIVQASQSVFRIIILPDAISDCVTEYYKKINSALPADHFLRFLLENDDISPLHVHHFKLGMNTVWNCGSCFLLKYQKTLSITPG